MVKNWRYCCVLVGLLACVMLGLRADPEVGMTRDELIARYGDPVSSMKVGDREVASFSSGKVVLQEGKVVSCDFSTRASESGVAGKTISVVPMQRDGWITDFVQAKVLARDTKRKLLVLFTGSTWCPACIRFERVVGSSPRFIQAAQKNYVLVKLDYPRGELPMSSPRVKLLERYQVSGYPTLFTMGADGNGEARVDICSALYNSQTEVDTMLCLLAPSSSAKKPRGNTILFVVAGLIALVWWFRRR